MSNRKYHILGSPQERYIWFRTLKCANWSTQLYLNKHSDPQIDGLLPYDTKWDFCFRFTFVRNPWDRLVSCWENKIGPRGRQPGAAPGLRKTLGDQKVSFREFIKTITVPQNLDADPHWQPCSLGFPSKDIDFIGRVENFEEDFKVVLKEIGLQGFEIPHAMKSIRGPYPSYYDAETRALVEKAYVSDIAAFGYEFEDSVEEVVKHV